MESEKHSRLQRRLTRSVAFDRGEAPQALLEALQSGGSEAERLEAVAEALSNARVLVGITPADGDSELRLITLEGQTAIDAFSGLTSMQEADTNIRPAPMPIREVAMTAVGLGISRIAIDRDVVLPPMVTLALAAGDPWIAPWKDELLLNQLRDSVASQVSVPGIQIAKISIREEVSPISIDIAVGSQLDPASTKKALERIVANLAKAPRLGALREPVRFIPRLLPMV